MDSARRYRHLRPCHSGIKQEVRSKDRLVSVPLSQHLSNDSQWNSRARDKPGGLARLADVVSSESFVDACRQSYCRQEVSKSQAKFSGLTIMSCRLARVCGDQGSMLWAAALSRQDLSPMPSTVFGAYLVENKDIGVRKGWQGCEVGELPVSQCPTNGSPRTGYECAAQRGRDHTMHAKINGHHVQSIACEACMRLAASMENAPSSVQQPEQYLGKGIRGLPPCGGLLQ